MNVTVCGMEKNVVGVVIVYPTQPALFPDSMCTSDDVVHDVGVDVLKAIQHLATNAVVGKELADAAGRRVDRLGVGEGGKRSYIGAV